jgi:hypothetical protein
LWCWQGTLIISGSLEHDLEVILNYTYERTVVLPVLILILIAITHFLKFSRLYGHNTTTTPQNHICECSVNARDTICIINSHILNLLLHHSTNSATYTREFWHRCLQLAAASATGVLLMSFTARYATDSPLHVLRVLCMLSAT